MKSSVLIIGVGGHVVAIDDATGTELWRTRVKGSDIVTIRVAGDRIFAGANGELFCLDAASGKELWRNRLKGLGLGLVCFDDGNAAPAGARVAAQRRAAAAGAMVAASS